MHPQTLSEGQRVSREGGFGTVGASPRARGSGAASPPVQPAFSGLRCRRPCGPRFPGITPCLPPSTAAVPRGPPRTGPAGQVRGCWGRGHSAELGPCSAAVRSHTCVRGQLRGPRLSGQSLEQRRCFPHGRLSVSRVRLVLEPSCWWSVFPSTRFPPALAVGVNGHGLPRGSYRGRI